MLWHTSKTHKMPKWRDTQSHRLKVKHTPYFDHSFMFDQYMWPTLTFLTSHNFTKYLFLHITSQPRDNSCTHTIALSHYSHAIPLLSSRHWTLHPDWWHWPWRTNIFTSSHSSFHSISAEGSFSLVSPTPARLHGRPRGRTLKHPCEDCGKQNDPRSAYWSNSLSYLPPPPPPPPRITDLFWLRSLA